MNPQKKSEAENQERAIVIAERIKLLFNFCADLIPEMELLKEISKQCDDRTSTAISAAPILGALGKDYEEIHLEATIRARRAKALYDLISVLEDTERERAEYRDAIEKKNANLAILMNHFGMS